MPISTDDCKTLLVQDTLLRAAGALDVKGWKRLSKKKGALGIERVFSHPSGLYAKMIESGNTLWIAASATSLAELDDPLNQRVVTPVTSVTTSSQTQWCWPAQANPVLTQKAYTHVHDMLAAFCNDEDLLERLYNSAGKLNPVALANQYTFAICRDDESSAQEMTWACVTPTQVWDSEHCCYDQGSPIEHLLPAGSEDLNESGSWVVHGFEDATPLALATFLLAKGFQWDPAFQVFIDDCAGVDQCSGQLAALLAARQAGPGLTP